MEFQRSFVFAADALVHIRQGNFEAVGFANFKGHQAACEVDSAPVVPLDAELFVEHVHVVGVFEKASELFAFRVLETGKPVELSLLGEDSNAPSSGQALPIDELDLVLLNVLGL